MVPWPDPVGDEIAVCLWINTFDTHYFVAGRSSAGGIVLFWLITVARERAIGTNRSVVCMASLIAPFPT